MNVMAWFDAEPIPLSVFEPAALTDHLQRELSDETTAWDESRLDAAIANLSDFSMVQWVDESVRVHRVVQEILRSRHVEPKKWLTTALGLLQDAIPDGNPGDVGTWPRWELLRAHIQSATLEAEPREIHVPTSTLRGELGSLLSAKALHNAAEQLERRALAIDLTEYGSESTQVAIRLNNLAQTLQDTNRLSEAEPLMRRHVVIIVEFGQSTGHEHPHMKAAISNYRLVLHQLGKSEFEIDQIIADLLN